MSGSIQIQLTVTDLVEQTQNKYSEDDLTKITLLQAEADIGFKDVQGFILTPGRFIFMEYYQYI